MSSPSIATTAGISGGMIRDMMTVQCIEKRFDARAQFGMARTGGVQISRSLSRVGERQSIDEDLALIHGATPFCPCAVGPKNP